MLFRGHQQINVGACYPTPMSTTKHIPSTLGLPRVFLTMPDGKGPLPWLTLPNELKIRVMRQLVSPSVSLTEFDARPGRAARRADNEPWASRQALAVACLASGQLEAICRPLLYEEVVLKDYRELVCLLRSLVRNPRLHTWVRRFVWLDITRGVGAHRSVAETGLDVQGLVAEITAFRLTTGDELNLAEIFQLRTTDSLTVFLRHALSVVLAMVPRIQALFVIHGGFPLDFLGLNNVTFGRPHSVTHLLSPTLPSLGMLEEITVDLSRTPWTLWYLILNCPRLRRVQLKGPIGFGTSLDPRVVQANDPNSATMEFHMHLLPMPKVPRPVGDKVQELVLYRSQRVRWNVLPQIFPNLERLVAVFDNDGWRRYRSSELPPLPASETVSNELGQTITLYKRSLRSLTVTGFLSDHRVTTLGGYREDAEEGHLWLPEPIPPLLSPGLAEVPLLELTTDCVCLFGRVEPLLASQIQSLLPSSLVSFHLIDYWTVSVDEVVIVDGKPRGYYPVSPSGLTPLDFLDNVFIVLHDSCAAQRTRLKHITLSSPMFDEDGRWSTPATRPVVRKDVQAWRARTYETFARIGIDFSFTTMKDLETSIKSSWGRI